MTVELTMVVYTTLLLLVHILTQALCGVKSYGLKHGVGARDSDIETNIYHGRATRALQNLIEAIVIFVPLVFVLHLAGIHNATTVLMTKIFVAARIAFFILYMFGVPWLRTIMWFISLVAIIALFLQAL